MKEMQSPGLLHVFVSEAIKYSLENSSECRRLVGQLFNKLLQDGTLALDRMVAGYVGEDEGVEGMCMGEGEDVWSVLV